MAVWIDRVKILDQVVEDLIATTVGSYPYIGNLTSENIRRSENDPLDIKNIREHQELWVNIVEDPVEVIASSKQSHHPLISFLVLVNGWEGLDDKDLSIHMMEDVEHYYYTNPDIMDGATRLAHVADPGAMSMRFTDSFPEQGCVYYAYSELQLLMISTA